jgi:hypothetical protein
MPKKKIKIKSTVLERKFWRNRVRDPNLFTTCRTPEWARRVAESISKGSKVVTCKLKNGEWKVQTILIKKERHTKSDARRLSQRILDKIEKQ